MVKKIEKYRKQLKLSQEELGNKLFVSRQTVSQWENDQTSPTIDNFLRLCDVFGISMNDFFKEKISEVDSTTKICEQYNWKYSEDELNDSFRVLGRKDTVSSVIALFLLSIIAIIALILKIWVGLAFACVFLISRIFALFTYQVSYKNSYKQAINTMLDNEYHICVDDSSVVITVLDNLGRIISLDRIYPIYIEKSWHTEDLFIIQYKQRRYIVKKNEIPQESQLGSLLGL